MRLHPDRFGLRRPDAPRNELTGGVTGGGTAVLRLYDVIDSWGDPYGVSAKDFAETLDALPASVATIELHLNSPGGEVFEAIAILNLLRQHPAVVNVVVDGLAASAASVVACAGATLTMSPNSQLMVHNAWGAAVGDAQDLHDTADQLDKLTLNLADVYARKSGKPAALWLQMMEAETWLSDQEAVTAGLADRVAEVKTGPVVPLPDDDEQTPDDVRQTPMAPAAMFDLSRFAFAGRACAPAPRLQLPQASASGRPTTTKGAGMDPAVLRAELALPADAPDEDVLTAAREFREAAGRANASVDGQWRAALDEARQQVRDLSGQLAQFRSDQADRDRESFLASAVNEGRITPAERERFGRLWAADRNLAAEMIADRAVGSALALTEVGHSTAPADDFDADYERLFPRTVNQES